MKICKEHISSLKDGVTYQLVNESECYLCKYLNKIHFIYKTICNSYYGWLYELKSW